MLSRTSLRAHRPARISISPPAAFAMASRVRLGPQSICSSAAHTERATRPAAGSAPRSRPLPHAVPPHVRRCGSGRWTTTSTWPASEASMSPATTRPSSRHSSLRCAGRNHRRRDRRHRTDPLPSKWLRDARLNARRRIWMRLRNVRGHSPTRSGARQITRPRRPGFLPRRRRPLSRRPRPLKRQPGPRTWRWVPRLRAPVVAPAAPGG